MTSSTRSTSSQKTTQPIGSGSPANRCVRPAMTPCGLWSAGRGALWVFAAMLVAWDLVPVARAAEQPPPMPKQFDRATVVELLASVDEGHNAAVLKVGYFARRARNALPPSEGLALVGEALSAEKAGTPRWFALQSVMAFGAFRAGPGYRDAGYAAYDALLSTAAESRHCEPTTVRLVQRSLKEFAVTLLGNYGVQWFHVEEKAGPVLAKALSAYVVLASASEPGPYVVPWKRLVEATWSRKTLQPVAERALLDPAVTKNSAVLKALAGVLAGHPDRAVTLLRRAKERLPKKDSPDALAVCDALVDALVAAQRGQEAVAVQKERIRESNTGRARLIVLEYDAGNRKALGEIVRTLPAQGVGAGETNDVAEALYGLYRKHTGARNALAAEIEWLLTGFLGSPGPRPTAEELRARMTLASVMADEGKHAESLAAADTGGITVPPAGTRERWLYDTLAQLRLRLRARATGVEGSAK